MLSCGGTTRYPRTGTGLHLAGSTSSGSSSRYDHSIVARMVDLHTQSTAVRRKIQEPGVVAESSARRLGFFRQRADDFDHEKDIAFGLALERGHALLQCGGKPTFEAVRGLDEVIVDLPTGTLYPALHRLERAGLVATRKVGRVRTCRLGARTLADEAAWIERYRQLWAARFDELDIVVEELKRKEKANGRKKRK